MTTHSFTEGPVARTLLVFALPTLASSVLQSVNASINAAWVARLLGTRALAASANANSLLLFVLGAVFGIGLAATIMVGQALGGNDVAAAKRTVGTSVTFFGIVTIAGSVVGAAFAPQVLVAMHTPADALPLAAAYLRVIFLALPALVLYSFVMMALRGEGDAKTPFVFLLLSAAIDVGLNPILIRGIGPIRPLGIAGSALATLIAQWTSLFALIVWLYIKKNPLRLSRDEIGYLRIDLSTLRTLLGKGIPIGLSIVLASASMLAMITLVNRNGSEVTAAYGACFQLWNYIQMPAFALGSAVSSMAAQNVGAGRWDRVAAITRSGVLFSIVLTGLLVVLVSLAARPAFALFLGDDVRIIGMARHIHNVVSWSFVLFGVYFVLSSVVRSAGAVMAPLLILFAALWCVRIPFAYALTPTLSTNAIWWSFPVGSLVAMLLAAAYYRSGAWREAPALDVHHHAHDSRCGLH